MKMFGALVITALDFAQAFWIDEGDPNEKGWQYHLQQMVLEEDKFKYLEKFL